jgi:aldose 1-epimerase
VDRVTGEVRMTADAPAAGADPLVLEAGGSRLEVDSAAGGRMASLIVDGSELLARTGSGPIYWGCYPMVPYPGRVRDGTFEFQGRRVELPHNLPPHAIHGTVFDRPWTVVDDRTLSIELGPAWPFAGRVTQRFELAANELRASLTLEADEPMPGAVGWHPWFPRRLTGSAAIPAVPSPPAELGFDAAWMLVRDAAGIPTGQLIEPTAPPWDDCFTGLRSTPRLTWPGVLSLELSSSCDYWVVYDEPADTICVEPQSSPPDFVNIDPVVVTPGDPLTATMTWRWRTEGELVGGEQAGQP